MTKTDFAKTINKSRIGSIPGCIALQSHDLGRATLEDGREVYITWGANYTPDQAAWFSANTGFEPIEIGRHHIEFFPNHHVAFFELVLSDRIGSLLASMIQTVEDKTVAIEANSLATEDGILRATQVALDRLQKSLNPLPLLQ